MTITNPNKIAPLIKDYAAWEAFIALLDHEQAKCIKKLQTVQDPNELIRINAEYRLIEQLRKARDNWLDIERMMKKDDE